jgi:hypothetical protein
MALSLKPIRRVVTGNDAQGRSGVLFDGPAPNVNPGAREGPLYNRRDGSFLWVDSIFRSPFPTRHLPKET